VAEIEPVEEAPRVKREKPATETAKAA